MRSHRSPRSTRGIAVQWYISNNLTTLGRRAFISCGSYDQRAAHGSKVRRPGRGSTGPGRSLGIAQYAPARRSIVQTGRARTGRSAIILEKRRKQAHVQRAQRSGRISDGCWRRASRRGRRADSRLRPETICPVCLIRTRRVIDTALRSHGVRSTSVAGPDGTVDARSVPGVSSTNRKQRSKQTYV